MNRIRTAARPAGSRTFVRVAATAAALIASLCGCRHKPPIAQVPVSAPAPQHEIAMPPLPGGVKAIYVTGWIAGAPHSFANLVAMVDRTELNAMVIDVKDDGAVSYDVDVPLAREIHASRHMFKIERVMATLQKHDIWPIARIACMRDTPLAKAHPEMAVHGPDGKPWHDRTKHYWLNPYDRKVWDYNVDIALDALKHGFKEIQFDYVRFPSEGNLNVLKYPGRPAGSMRQDEIAAFAKYARARIHAAGGWFAADVFGLTSKVKNDEGIGQKFQMVDRNVDFLCPMVYPSHYHHHEYGIPDPNREPYKIIHLSVGDALKRMKGTKDCELRPWIQDFSLYGVTYGPEQVKQEIKALSDLGIRQFMIWNPKCRYHEAALTAAPAATASTPASTHTGKDSTG